MKIENLEQSANLLKNNYPSFQGNFAPIIARGNIAQTLDHVLQLYNRSKQNELLLLVGSFFIMPEARKFFGYSDVSDPLDLNEVV